MRTAILSSLAKDSGCWLRAGYLADSLKNNCEVKFIQPLPKTLPFMLDMFISIPINLIKVTFSKADFFIGIKPYPNITIPLLFVKIFKGKRIGVDIDDLDSGYRKGILSKISSALQKPFPKYFDIVTYHNPLLKDHIIKEFKVEEERLYKLDQGVDLKTFDYKLNKPEKETLFYMGHLNIASDLDSILKAVKLVQDKKNVKFVIVGGGPDQAKFRKLARQLNVSARFTGHLSKEETAKELSKADVCLIYYKEKKVNAYRCSMKLRECLAMGKKIVCNDFGDLKKFEKYTYQSSSNLEDFADKIIQTLKKSDQREIKGLRYIRKNLDWNKIGKDFFNKINL